ncbi:MAG: tyrosine-type recombinase/integrase [Ktedonobacterales bacterium]
MPDISEKVLSTQTTAWDEVTAGEPAASDVGAENAGTHPTRNLIEDAGDLEVAVTPSSNGKMEELVVLNEERQHGSGANSSVVDLAIAAWIAAKFGRTGSEETRLAYHRTIHEFRAQVRAADMDLDAADPRHVRHDVLEQLAEAETLADFARAVDSVESAHPTASWPGGSSDRAPGTADHGASAAGVYGIRAELRRAVDLQTRIDEEVARREAALALAAQAYAAQPPRRAVRQAHAATRAATNDRTAQATGDLLPVLVVTDSGALLTRTHRGASGDMAGASRRVVKSTTYNRRLAIISSFYSYALRHDLLRGRTNPISRVERRPAEAYAAARPLSYAALRRDLAQFTSDEPADLRDRALLLVGLHTGHRLSELWRMRLEHLTVTPDAIEILWPYCKGGKVMRSTLPLTSGGEGVAGRALLAWVEYLSEYTAQYRSQLTPLPGVESERGGQRPAHRRDHLRYSIPQEQAEGPLWINLARNAAGLHPISKRTIATICGERLGTTKVHSLRHTFARTLEDAGVKVSEIQQILGHSDLGMTGRYLARLRSQHIPHLDRVAELYGLGV